MADRNRVLLLEYLRSILYNTNMKPLEIDELDEPYRELGKDLHSLQAMIAEMLSYSAELSKGNLSAAQPRRDNFLCTDLRSIHDMLNTMTEQLREREERLAQEAAIIKQRSEAFSVYNEMLSKMTTNMLDWIFVVDAQTHEIVYCNKPKQSCKKTTASPCRCCTRRLPGHGEIIAWEGAAQEVWDIHPAPNVYYQVNSYPIEWQGYRSYVHVVTDISEQILEKDYLSAKAYFDPVTSIHNRTFFEEYMKKILEEKQPITLCYLDLDGLKYVNDHFGHTEGDQYIMTFARLIKENFRSDDVFARIGGDEFCLVLEGRLDETARKKLELAREKLIAENTKPYPVSFSYGVHEIHPDSEEVSLSAILHEADLRMYQYKQENKKARN